MSKFSFAVACLVSVGIATPVYATNYHSYMSANGTGIACTLAAPCDDFAAAIAATTNNGLISCLDGLTASTLAGIANINKSVTLDCAGASATVWWITINSPGVVVTLRNLTIGSVGAGYGGGTAGIHFVNGAALFVEHCVIEHWQDGQNGTGIGIHFAPANGVAAELHVSDSVIKNNGLPASGGGIVIQPAGSGSARVTIERTQVKHNTYGIFANGTGSTGNIIVHVKDSVVSNSVFGGVSAYTSAGQSVVAITMDRSSSLLNGADGILSQSPNAYVLLSNATVLSNATGLHSVSGGNILSYQNNTVTGNVSDGAATGMLTVK